MKLDLIYNEYVSFLDLALDNEELSESTHREYKTKTSDLVCFLANLGIVEANDITYLEISKYINHKKNVASTKQTTLEIIKHMINYFSEDHYINIDLKKIKIPKVSKKPPQYLTDAEVSAIFTADVFSKPWYGDRNKFIVLLLINSGIRVSELVSITMNDINSEECFIVISGKGGKVRYVYYPNTKAFNSQLSSWLSIRPECDNLICTKKGKTMTTRNVQKIIKSILEYSGIGKNAIRTSLGPHLLRHTFATKLVNNNVNMGAIQELLGHSDISTTTRYAHVRKESLHSLVSEFETKDT